ncbi:MAG: hypothetical protein IKT40_00505 [Bacilli bacterium]|nr:hypothetical protein [Bacilli bacterium]
MTKKHKEFIKQIKSMPRCTVTPEDIYEKTDFFDRQPSPRRSNPFKLAFLVCVALVFVTLTSTIILGVQNHQLKNQEPQIIQVNNYVPVIDDTNGMPEEMKTTLIGTFKKFLLSPIFYSNHTKEIAFYIYYGYDLNQDGTKLCYYYYSFVGKKYYDVSYITIKINDEIIIIDDSNSIGLLTTIDGSKTDNFDLNFTVISSEKTCEYTLKDCVFE